MSGTKRTRTREERNGGGMSSVPCVLAANISSCGGWAWQERGGGVSPSVLLLCA